MHAFGSTRRWAVLKGADVIPVLVRVSRRQGLYEVMALTSPLRREILEGASTEELRDLAVKEGMLTAAHGRDGEGQEGVGLRSKKSSKKPQLDKERSHASQPSGAARGNDRKRRSDLHLVAGERPKMRVDGDIVNASSEEVMTPKDTLSLAYSVLTETRRSASRPRTSSIFRSASRTWRVSAATCSSSAAACRSSSGRFRST